MKGVRFAEEERKSSGGNGWNLGSRNGAFWLTGCRLSRGGARVRHRSRRNVKVIGSWSCKTGLGVLTKMTSGVGS